MTVYVVHAADGHDTTQRRCPNILKRSTRGLLALVIAIMLLACQAQSYVYMQQKIHLYIQQVV